MSSDSKAKDDVDSDEPKSSPVDSTILDAVDDEPSMTVALFLYWVVPVLFIAVVSRFGVDTSVSPIPPDPNQSPAASFPSRSPVQTSRGSRVPSQGVAPSGPPAASPNWPTAYRSIVESIEKKRRPVYRKRHEGRPSAPKAQGTQSATVNQNTPARARGRSTDPQRAMLAEKIESLREIYNGNKDDIFDAIMYADAMRFYDLHYHEGGTYEKETLELYEKITLMAEQRLQRAKERGERTNESLSGTRSVNDEITLDYKDKSPDGLVCAVYVAQGKVEFMANMFERAARSYSRCLEIEPYYLDALNSRASTYIILGRYEEAGKDFVDVIQRDKSRLFHDAFTGLARVLEAKEEVVPGGWDLMTKSLEQLIPQFEHQLASYPQAKSVLGGALARFYHVMFSYHDIKTKNAREAFRYLTESYKQKMSLLPPWNKGFEWTKIETTKSIFRPGFWPDGVGSQTKVPIFIIGFVRSGSTLLERVLDAHPMIVGTGENSVFNGRLDEIRNRIVQVSVSGNPDMLAETTREMADEVVGEMKRRWEVIQENTEKDGHDAKEDPKRFVDKMLTNYYNVGFIHLLYPNALILHVAREPMDCVFSAYKHEFPAGTLDYTCEFEGLAELYNTYRDLMDHWDEVLPGRVKHIRYKDMVNDMPGVARAIIDATGLPWDDSVLDFHKKKHAVNTWSSTQVRKGVYKDGINSWKRYEEHLQPLVKLLGKRVRYDLETTLPGYQPQFA